jgi:hypothetical protein
MKLNARDLYIISDSMGNTILKSHPTSLCQREENSCPLEERGARRDFHHSRVTNLLIVSS